MHALMKCDMKSSERSRFLFLIVYLCKSICASFPSQHKIVKKKTFGKSGDSAATAKLTMSLSVHSTFQFEAKQHRVLNSPFWHTKCCFGDLFGFLFAIQCGKMLSNRHWSYSCNQHSRNVWTEHRTARFIFRQDA